MENVELSAYKGSNIEKGFSNQAFNEAALIVDVVGNFNKGLIDEDVFEKAIGETNKLKGVAPKGSFINANNGWKIEKGESGWAIEKGKKDEEDKADEDDVEKAFKKKVVVAKKEDDDVEKGLLDKTFRKEDDVKKGIEDMKKEDDGDKDDDKKDDKKDEDKEDDKK